MQPVRYRRPARARGQNLLIDRSVARRIVKASRLPFDAAVLEIGAGTGMLTVELARVARRLVAIEIEYALAQRLKRAVSRYSNVRVVRADARRVHVEELMEGEAYHVVSNLPYSVGTPLTIDLLQSDFRPASLTIMLQLEVAERLCAGPGSMSLLSVIAQSYAEPRFLFIVEPESFRPRPKVRSAVVRLVTNTVPRKDVLTKAAIFLARHAFAGRRKKVQNSLAGGLQRSSQGGRRTLRAGRHRSRRAGRRNSHWISGELLELPPLIKDLLASLRLPRRPPKTEPDRIERLLVFLGNPGPRYELTRHNLGFMAGEHLLAHQAGARFRQAFKARFWQGHIEARNVGVLTAGNVHERLRRIGREGCAPRARRRFGHRGRIRRHGPRIWTAQDQVRRLIRRPLGGEIYNQRAQ